MLPVLSAWYGVRSRHEGVEMNAGESYPVRLLIEYPESSNRFTVLIRPILAAPIIVLLHFLSGDSIVGQPASWWASLLAARSGVVVRPAADDRLRSEISSLVL